MIFIYLQSCIHHLKGLFESNLVTCFLLVHIRTVIYSDIYLIPLPHFTTPQNFYSYCNNWKLLITVANYEWTYVQIRWTIHQTTWLLKRKSLNLHNQTSAFIFSILFFIHLPWHYRGEFGSKSTAFHVCDHFINSHEPNVWFSSNTFVRNYMLVILRG